MESKIQVLGHPVHQLAVALPIGAMTLTALSDGLELVTGDRKFRTTARVALDVGLLSALGAAPFGLIDWLAIPPRTRAKRVGLWHLVGNVAALSLFATARVLRRRGDATSLVVSKAVTGGGLGLIGVAAWFGGELVSRHAIGVHDISGLDAPSSLTKPERRYARVALYERQARESIPNTAPRPEAQR